MNNQINWTKKCEKIAAELAEEVVSKFLNNEEIKLYLSRPIASGDVYGLFAQTPLHDQWHTVIVQYAVIPRSKIVLDKNLLQKIALDKMLEITGMECWQQEKSSPEFADTLREFAEQTVGNELFAVFSQTAIANPGQYPIRETHGHAAPEIGPNCTVNVLNIRKIDLF